MFCAMADSAMSLSAVSEVQETSFQKGGDQAPSGHVGSAVKQGKNKVDSSQVCAAPVVPWWAASRRDCSYRRDRAAFCLWLDPAWWEVGRALRCRLPVV